MDEDETEQRRPRPRPRRPKPVARASEDRRGRRRRRRRRAPRRDEGRGRAPREAAEAPANGDEPARRREPDRRGPRGRTVSEARRRRSERPAPPARPARRPGARAARGGAEPAAAMQGNGEMPVAETIEIVGGSRERADRDAEASIAAANRNLAGRSGMETASLAPFAGEQRRAAARPRPRPASAAKCRGRDPGRADRRGRAGIPFVGEARTRARRGRGGPRRTNRRGARPAPAARTRPARTRSARTRPARTRGAIRPNTEAREPIVPARGHGLHEPAPHEHEAAPRRSERERRPAEEYSRVTEKPANPRRGWWQRLIAVMSDGRRRFVPACRLPAAAWCGDVRPARAESRAAASARRRDRERHPHDGGADLARRRAGAERCRHLPGQGQPAELVRRRRPGDLRQYRADPEGEEPQPADRRARARDRPHRPAAT